MTNYILVPTKTKTNIAFVDGILVFVDDNTVSPVGYPEMYQYQELYLKDIPATNLQEKEIKEFISFFNKKND